MIKTFGLRKYRFGLLLLTLFAFAHSATSPMEFANRLYERYRNQQIPDLTGGDGDSIFAPRFLEKYRELSKKSTKRHGLGWDIEIDSARQVVEGILHADDIVLEKGLDYENKNETSKYFDSTLVRLFYEEEQCKIRTNSQKWFSM